MSQTPPGWGNDILAHFDDICRQNALATFVRTPELWRPLTEVLKVFAEFATILDNTSKVGEAMFVFRSHAAFLGASRFAVSGQVVESHMVLRGCLEAALYSNHISTSPAAWEDWIHRHDDEAGRSRSRTTFSYSRALQSLATSDPQLHARVSTLYDTTIDLGAHPNERAITGMLTIDDKDDSTRFTLNYVAPGSTAHTHCLRFAAQAGITALAILAPAFRERTVTLGLDIRITQLSRKLFPSGE